MSDKKMTRLLCHLGVAALLLAGTAVTHAQDATASSVAVQGQSGEGMVIALPATKIFRLMDEQPQIIVELKQLLAQRLHAQGVAIDDDGISDEALFREISRNLQFRSASTILLRARGYVTDAEIELERSSQPAIGQVDRVRDDGSIDTISNEMWDQSLDPQHGSSSETGGLGANADLWGIGSGDTLPPARADALRSLGMDDSSGLPQASSSPLGGDTAGPYQKQQRTLVQPQSQMQEETTHAGPRLLRQPAPYNLLAMRDLYTQIPQQEQKLKRFGSDVFVARNSQSVSGSALAGQTRAMQSSMTPMNSAGGLATPIQNSALDQAPGPDYVLGRGDGLTITLWGGISQTFTRVVDPMGQLVLPEVGPVSVAGLRLEKAQSLIEGVLAPQYRDVHVTVAITRVRNVRIYVVGDVQRPGAYDIPAQATPLSALYAAGGPTAVGSLRTLRHMRGNTLVHDVDLYDFLLHGMRTSTEALQDGDTILVPPVGPQIAIAGSVKRPAIYELKGEAKLSEVLDDAGGTEVSAALAHITVDRISANEQRETVKVGDPTADITTLRKTLEAFTVKDGDRVIVGAITPWSDSAVYVEGHVVRPGRQPYHDNMMLTDVIRSYRDLLPEPADRGQIIRLAPPDLRPKTIDFNLADALAGNDPIHLQPFDTIRILGRYDSDAPKVTVRGEVLKPGVYALAAGMTASELVKIAGGLTRGALRTSADLASYEVQGGTTVVSRRATIAIGDAMQAGGGANDSVLKAGDVLTIHQISGWTDIGASVRVSGEVNHPGSYGIEQGEKLSSVLKRAGGFRETAYPTGAILMRLQVRDLEEKSRLDLIRQIETSPAATKLGTNLAGQDQAATVQLLQQQQNQVLQQLRSETSSGRLVVRIDSDLSKWENTQADVELRSGDVLVIPKRPGFVLVSGQVYNATAQTYVPNKTAGWYLKRAGGATDLANDKEIFIVRANGAVIGRRSGNWYDGRVLSTKLDAGDVIVVPQKIVGGSMFWRNLLTVAQILSAAALPLAIAGV